MEIIALESSATPNITKVVFAIESDATTKSLIRANFVSLITHQSFLRLTESLFGDPFEFDVLKFRGGITVSPEQKAFLMQNVQIIFNFTLNFSIDEILVNFEQLRSQLNAGLHLAPYEVCGRSLLCLACLTSLFTSPRLVSWKQRNDYKKSTMGFSLLTKKSNFIF